MSVEIKIHYEFETIRFVVVDETNEGLVLAEGKLKTAGVTGRFKIAMASNLAGEWELRNVGWAGEVGQVLQNQQVLQALVNQGEKILKTVNCWPEITDNETGARLIFNEQLAPSSVADKVIISFRPKMLSLPMTNWESVWSLIEGRIKGDRYFRIQGFNNNQIEKAIIQLKQIFPASWVRAKYRKSSQEGVEPKMGADFPPETENWFPAYHLARTALGAICIDPGWNYLIEIGLSITELSEFEGIKRLKRELTRSPGTQHHLCLAADLFRKGHLIALEPLTGSGGSRNDLLVSCGNQKYEIEVKEFSSDNPARQLLKEIKQKCNQLPKQIKRAIVFHAVLIENGFFNKEREELFFQAVKEIAPSIHPKISAIVAGSRFVDSSGGRVKRNTETPILNPNAYIPSKMADLVTLFTNNYDTIKYPMFGIGTFFYFSNEPNSGDN